MNIDKTAEKSNKTELPLEELEKLNYYDLFALLNIPFFNVGGRASIDKLAEMCSIKKGSRVLEVGCGTGSNACYLAQKYECIVVGIDVSNHMIQKAREQAKEMGLTDKVSFEVGDAYQLRFEDSSFDTVMTIFVSHFLDIQKAFKEFVRVIKQGGIIDINEMCKMDEIPEDPANKIIEGEKIFGDLVQLPFKLYTLRDWKYAFEKNSCVNIHVEHNKILREKGELKRIVHDMGGYKKFLSLLGKPIKLVYKSKPIRQKFSTMSKAKKVLMRQKVTAKYVGYILAAGQKP